MKPLSLSKPLRRGEEIYRLNYLRLATFGIFKHAILEDG